MDPAPPLEARAYSRGELLADRIVHLAALAAALAAVPVLVTLTVLWRGDAAGIVGVSVYGGTRVLMLTASLLYNHLPAPARTDLLRRLDMSAIHLKIAGTYTPFALLSGTGSGLLAAIWSAAAGSTALIFLMRRLPSGLAILLCLCTGWAVVLGGRDLLAAMPLPVVGLMLAGGILYSLGTPFLLASRLRFHNAIWHGMVVAASALLFAAVCLVVAAPPVT